jgi:hypothetical protein
MGGLHDSFDDLRLIDQSYNCGQTLAVAPVSIPDRAQAEDFKKMQAVLKLIKGMGRVGARDLLGQPGE